MLDLSLVTPTIIAAYSAMDFDAVGAYLHEDFVIHFLPASLGRPSLSRPEYLLWLATLKSTFRSLDVCCVRCTLVEYLR